MAIVDTVWGRLTRCNPPDDGSIGFVPAEEKAKQPKTRRHSLVLIAIGALRWITVAAVLALIAWAAMWEMGTSHYQAKLFTHLAGKMTFTVADGSSDAIRFPKTGPCDERLGYIGLPGFLESLTRHGFKIETQARWSPALVE